MRYLRFRIRNFKGIKDTTINLETIAGASVFAFVGLNESGKTTILEAIHSFSPDDATSELLAGDKHVGVPFAERVPRHQLSSFTGNVSVMATLQVQDEEKQTIAKQLAKERQLTLDWSSIPSELTFERKQRFADGDLQKNYFDILGDFRVRTPGNRKWRAPTAEELTLIRDEAYSFTPDISYFPTFVFNFPDRIFLTDRGDKLDRFYRSVFQDILDYDGKGYTIEKDIVRRVRGDSFVIPWLNFLELWARDDAESKIQHVIDRASATVTNVVFGRWNRIFGEDTRGKEIIVSYGVAEGEVKDTRGVVSKTHSHDVHIKFQIRDGTRRFDVNDRSLGFRWFFAFMLFTQFRVARASTRPLLFLFDEPASNLHAAAQQKLIDCFPEIAKGPHALAYTTHSHYMIEPKWLEQTFIVTNRADGPPTSVVDAISLDDESLDIKATTYRSFVNDHPGQTSYFQPILDRLDVVPSRFDLQKVGIVVEGKSDYYILRYAAKLLGFGDLPLVPGLGAGTFGALAAMHAGWNLHFLFVLDGDKQGNEERSRYVKEYGIPICRLCTIDNLVTGVTEIEDLLDDEARDAVKKQLEIAGKPTKAHIRRFFQERLASDQVASLGSYFDEKAKILIEALMALL